MKRGETTSWVEGCPIFMGFAEQINFSDERFLTVSRGSFHGRWSPLSLGLWEAKYSEYDGAERLASCELGSRVG